MNWLMNSWKTISDWLGTSDGHAFIIALVTSVATIVLSLAIPAFGRFLRRLLKLGWRFPLMCKKWYREWNYWRRFGPSYSVTSALPVVVKALYDSNKKLSTYQISLTIRLRCQKMDDSHSMTLQCNEMGMTIVPQNIKGRILSYPLIYNEGTPTWRFITPNPIEADYTLRRYSEIRPILGDTVRCEKIYLGTVNINNVERRLKAKPFCVSVEWFKNETPA